MGDAVLFHVQKAMFDAYVEFPLMFNIQNEGLSAFYHVNVAAREAALGRKLNQKGPNFIVRGPPQLSQLLYPFPVSNLAFL